jgi:hypothetical protein
MALYKLVSLEPCDCCNATHEVATLSDIQAVLSEHGRVAVPLELSQEQRHGIKLQGDYCMQECEEFYSMVLKAAQGDDNDSM